jgi:hypothetical protein
MAAALALASCGGGDKAPLLEGESLQDYLGGTDTAAQQARFVRQLRIDEEKIAKCMRAQGFEYTAYVQPFNFKTTPQAKRGEEVAFKRKNGYGLADSMVEGTNSQPTVDNNPNTKRRQKLSESEQAAYQKALNGIDPTKPDQAGGCWGEVYGARGAVMKPLDAKIIALQKETETDPEILKLKAKFVSCMKKAGYAIAKEQDISEKILSEKQNKIYEDANKNASPPDTSASSGLSSPSTISPAKINELRTFELKVANADADCRPQKDVNRMFELTQKYEKAFIDDNKALLEKLKSSNG